ncbi:MAG: leucine-rich repeat domain-containing protein [Eubacterium sp.]|nr:leucine-rich repeat domain-containing protein [Eubacterium sp.]MCM1302913.1 leucine-rich repeat domain-containing protein [Butyrivibrio sp.]MCM1342985.1 hypothetical protein [Muribaculaceae bacterium]MCM1410715.1 leucine-rich repeat domain-containing protein [Lachnospiraceae bacterium]
MGKLTQLQIEKGLEHWNKYETPDKNVVELAEYTGERELTINCTQLDGFPHYPKYKSAREKKRVLSEWCQFLTENPNAFTSLCFGTRMPQELFHAVCEQKDLERLYIKWGVYPDISAISKLQKLEYLHIGSGAGVLRIEPLSRLKNLVALSVENFQKINDYHALAALDNLELLSIEGDWKSPRYIHIESLEFLREMKQLRSFSLTTARIASKDYTPILDLENLEYLSLPSCKEVKSIYGQLLKLPKLKYGWLIERSEFYQS